MKMNEKKQNDMVEEALLQIATGGELRDRTFELREDEEGGKNMVLVKEVIKQKEPDLAAVKMWLKARAGDRWQEEAGTGEAIIDIGELLREAKKLFEEVEGTKNDK